MIYQLLKVVDLVAKDLMEKKCLEEGLWVLMELHPQVMVVQRIPQKVVSEAPQIFTCRLLKA
jgi:hypothetical protein